MKIFLFFFLVTFSFCSYSQKKIFVKSVYINNKIVKTDSGFIIHLRGRRYIVNGKKVLFKKYKKTSDPEFKKNIK